MAKEYGQLPSFIQANASTFDIMVLDVMTTWEENNRKQANGQPVIPQVDQGQLETLLKQTKG
jgi:hypothetical protein